ncbi:hypothetical protein EC396_00995 [Lutibacter sp. HS1-25]|nr:hypothetical protein EC396_00995 [Lutibacter sp. HS1-25]
MFVFQKNKLLMKNTFYSIILFAIAITILGCSSIHVENKWAADNIAAIKTKKILVIARTANENVRKAFENDMVKQLKAKGLNAYASHSQHPDLKPEDKMTEERKAQVKQLFETEGYNGVVLTVLKDKLTNVKSTEEGGYYAGESLNAYFPPYIPVYSYGFYGGYYSPWAYPSGFLYNPKTFDSYGTYVPKSLETQTSYSFILETMVYNLDLPEDKQLAAYVTTRIDEPDNINGTANNYTKAVIASFKK